MKLYACFLTILLFCIIIVISFPKKQKTKQCSKQEYIACERQCKFIESKNLCECKKTKTNVNCVCKDQCYTII